MPKIAETIMEADQYSMEEGGYLWMLSEVGRVFCAERGTLNLYQTIPHNTTPTGNCCIEALGFYSDVIKQYYFLRNKVKTYC